jgi:hypothetical protein
MIYQGILPQKFDEVTLAYASFTAFYQGHLLCLYFAKHFQLDI